MSTNFEVNSAIESLIQTNGNDKKSAEVVIQFARVLPDKSANFRESRWNLPWKHKNIFSAFTKEAGNVSLKEEAEKEEEWFTKDKTRVGYYRLYRSGNKIFLHHYWASELSTQSLGDDRTETFIVSYDPSSLRYEWFGKIAKVLPSTKIRFLIGYREKWEEVAVLLNKEHDGQQIHLGFVITTVIY